MEQNHENIILASELNLAPQSPFDRRAYLYSAILMHLTCKTGLTDKAKQKIKSICNTPKKRAYLNKVGVQLYNLNKWGFAEMQYEEYLMVMAWLDTKPFG